MAAEAGELGEEVVEEAETESKGSKAVKAMKWVGNDFGVIIKALKELSTHIDRTSAVTVENKVKTKFEMRRKDWYFDCGGFHKNPHAEINSRKKNSWSVAKKAGAFGVCGAIRYDVPSVKKYDIVFVFYNPQVGKNRVMATWSKHDPEYVFTHWEDDFKYKKYDTHDGILVSASCTNGDKNEIVFSVTD